MVSISACCASLIWRARAATSGWTPRLASSRSLIETAWSWCGSITWTNRMSVSLKAQALGPADVLAEPCSLGIPDVPLSFAQPARTAMAAAAEIRLVLSIVISYQSQVSDGRSDVYGFG